jgi:hypothetical protein
MKVLVIVSDFAKSSCTRDYDNEWIHDQLTEIFSQKGNGKDIQGCY